MQRYKVSLKTESGIPQALRKYCDDYGISAWSFLADTIAERLQKPIGSSVAEMKGKRTYRAGSKYEYFYFGISDAIVQEKLRLIVEEYGVSLNYFFTQTIAEKLQGLGYEFANKPESVRKSKRKNAHDFSGIEQLRNFMTELDMRKK